MSRKELIKRIFRKFIEGIVTLFFVIGVVYSVAFYLFWTNTKLPFITYFGEALASLESVTLLNSPEWRTPIVTEYAINLTKDCKPQNDLCKAWRIFEFMEFNFTYTVTNDFYYDFDTAMRLRRCDCSTCTLVYCAMLRSLDIECYPVHDIPGEHTYALVNIDGTVYKVDIVRGIFIRTNLRA